MLIYFTILILIITFIIFLKIQERGNINTIEKILKSLNEKKIYDKIPAGLKEEYMETLHKIIKQDLELDNSIFELREYRKELEVTYNTLLEKSKKLEYSNQSLEEKVTSLSNINALSRTVLSIMDLDHIINIILDAYFVLTGAKKISLYLWEDGKLANKKVRGDIGFRGEVSFPLSTLKEFTYRDYKRVYEELKKEFPIKEEEIVIVSPLLIKEKEFGVIYIVEDKDKFTTNDEETISALAIQVAIAINNAKMYADLRVKERISQELEMAAKIQEKILPQNVSKIYGLQIEKYFSPAKEIGGDYYDYSIIDDETFSITIADVSGKGVPAAFLMALGRSIMKTLEIQKLTPAKTLKILNKIIYPDITEDMFITMLHSNFNYKTKVLTYSNAGHNPLVVYKAKLDEIQLHTTKGLAIGFLDDYGYCQKELKLDKGDIVVYYTDGITETENHEKELFGIERLKEVIYKSKNKTPCQIKDMILDAINDFRKGYQQVDDLTFVIIKNTEDSEIE
ncbi:MULTISPECIES: PP2C family protein-serine/threonine phosphatase [Fusobacterium]|uniref:PP2C family protein-serine/threonine phosphatase n=1 Tax=Fusobacterium TaxID=848 RepID=UPI001476EF8B|nr:MULTISPECIES: PP2C family protein-serine/threonine phosphatase [Fusobacterium]NME36178.1 PP2C family protein-serine/threonine phosphatase [Fusobacterium sp. FSA-380-WT-3A]